MNRAKNKKWSFENVTFTTLNTVFLLLLGAIMLYPILNTIAISFNDGLDAVKGGIGIRPRVFTLQNYIAVFHKDTLTMAFFVSVARVVVQVVTNVFFTAMLAYALSRNEYIFRKPVTVIFVLTMYFDAGLIPTYLLMRDLHLLNNFNVYWIPTIISAFNLIMIRTYMRTIPESLIESAKIDGAGEFRVWWQIIMPLCLPTLAVIALLVAVGSWNDWMAPMLYTSAVQKLSTLQFELQKYLASAMSQVGPDQATAQAQASTGGNQPTPISLRSAITIIAAVPILCVYPFLQRYFVQGLTIGGVKE